LSLDIAGPAVASLQEETDNLVLRAARLLAGRAGLAPRAALRLTKRIPVAAGLGGGSADAAATLLALVDLWRVAMPEEELFDLAAELGADVPMCLAGRPALVAGVGERLAPAPRLPPCAILLVNPGVDLWRVAMPEEELFDLAAELGADVPMCLAGRPALVAGVGERLAPAPRLPPCAILLVNPGLPLPTPHVFAARQGSFSAERPTPGAWPDLAVFGRELAARGNDLTDAAVSLRPEIASVLQALRGSHRVVHAAMSGSGATCFGLYETVEAAQRAAAALPPSWWRHTGQLATS